MSTSPDITSMLDIAQQTIAAAGCASLVTLDEQGQPSSRAVAAFAPDGNFSRIVVGTHPASRKTGHVRRNPRVCLSYVDVTNRGYVTVLGDAHISDDAQDKKEYWVDRFTAF